MSFSRMQLIGLQQRDPAPGDYRMIAEAFKRLPAEVMKPGQLNRMVGFQGTSAEGKQNFWFMGTKAIDTAKIPTGMVAWDLGDESLRISETQNDQKTLLEEHSIEWLWREALDTDPGQWIGEFVILPEGVKPGYGKKNHEPANVRRVFAVVPFDPQKGKMQDDVVLAPYSPDWPKKFGDIHRWITEKIGPDIATRIEHYGSTSIPGMSAKPVVDVLVEIPSFEKAAPKLLSMMSGAQWEFWLYSDHYVFFRRSGLMGPRQFHVHCAPKGHAIWSGLAFRDFLRAHTTTAQAYQQLKEKLSRQFSQDREAYTHAKTNFVMEITAQATRK